MERKKDTFIGKSKTPKTMGGFFGKTKTQEKLLSSLIEKQGKMQTYTACERVKSTVRSNLSNTWMVRYLES